MGYTVDGLSLGHGDEKIRTAAVKRMCDHVDLAEKLGGAMVIIGADPWAVRRCPVGGDLLSAVS